jgi:hypothetical protein
MKREVESIEELFRSIAEAIRSMGISVVTHINETTDYSNTCKG